MLKVLSALFPRRKKRRLCKLENIFLTGSNIDSWSGCIFLKMNDQFIFQTENPVNLRALHNSVFDTSEVRGRKTKSNKKNINKTLV